MLCSIASPWVGRFLLTMSLLGTQTIMAIALPVLNFNDRSAPQVTSNKIRFPQATNRGAPAATSGGGTRGETCLRNETTRLFPVGVSMTSVTTQTNPTLFVYLPEHRAANGKLLLLDHQGEEILQAEIALPSNNAILAIALPSSASLELNQTYAWRFTLNCPSKVVEGTIVEDDFTEANLKRVILDSAVDPNLTALEQAQVYVDNNAWNDVLTVIVPLREQEPETWQALLDYMNLGDLANTEIVFFQLTGG